MIKAKVVPINKIISDVTSNIKSEIDKAEETTVEVNIGKITGINLLSKIGPRVNIKLETSRSSRCKT